MSHLVLVTGGAGFIGSHLVDALLARGDRVRVLDDFSAGKRENLAHRLADIELFEGDVRDPGLVARAVAGCDGVLHEAAVASVTKSLEDPVGADSVTHGGTVNVVRLARRAGAGGFVLASSCAIYGDADALPIVEDTPPRPLSPYALAKLLSEGVCRAWASRPAERLPEALRGSLARGQGHREGGGQGAGDGRCDGGGQGAGSKGADMKSVCLRYFNVFGPRQDPSSEYSGVIARFMDVAAARTSAGAAGSGPRYVVYGDGRQSRDFVFVADVVAANLLALDACLNGAAAGATDAAGAGATDAGGALAADVDGAVLNVGTGVSIDLLHLVAETERLRSRGMVPRAGSRLGELEIAVEGRCAGETEAPIDWRPAREGDIRASQADISRARRLLGYEPAVSFADGLAATYEWYVARESGA